MKADKWGTPSENIRFAANWMPAAAARLARKVGSCGSCADFVDGPGPGVKVGPFCQHLGLATRQGAWCNHWRERQA